MIEPIRIGFIGTSWWMNRIHLPVFKADPRVELTAICGRNREHAQEIATKYGIANVFTDYQDMVTHADLQAIIIGSPDDLHYPMTMAALDAGLHVLCEKPLALNATSAKAMADRAQANGVRHMVFFVHRWLPNVRYMHELIQEGVLGRIYHCQFSFLMGGGHNPQYQWRYDRNRANGVLSDLGSHMVDLARYLVGDITRVNAHLTTSVQRKGPNNEPFAAANDSALVLLEFENGAQGITDVSAITRTEDPVGEIRIALHGEAGSLAVRTALGGSLQLRIAKGNAPLQLLEIPERFLTGMDTTRPYNTQNISMFIHQPIGGRLFVDSILDNQPVGPDFYDGWKTEQVVDAALAARDLGQRIDIQ